MRIALAIALVLPVFAACAPEPATPAADGVIAPLTDADFPDTPLGQAARRGRAILAATGDSLPGYVGNRLRCTTCHLDDGRRSFAMPWLGVHARYPQYRSRAAKVLTVEDRINECIERSLAGRPLPAGDARLRAMEAYFAFISRGTPVGERVAGQGIDSVRGGGEPGATAGKLVFEGKCARCHGVDGNGTELATPLWGDGAYSIAAGMARVRMAAGFIRHNMPYDMPGTLTDQEALDVAAYINSQPRPDYAAKSGDWPNGNAPPDVPYRAALGK